MRRRPLIALSTLLAIGAVPFPCSRTPAWSQERLPQERIVLIRDAETETLLHSFATPLFRAAGLDPGLVRILLVRDRAINAFVSSGNRMFLNTGLLQQATSALEVIGTMAHETGHVVHGDITRMPELEHQALLQALGSMLIAAAAGVASSDPGVGVGAALGGASMAERRFLSFTRIQEENADESALRFLDRVGWSAQGMLALFNRLEQQETLSVDRMDPYLITHPLTPDRIAFVREHVDRAGGRDQRLPSEFEARFAMVKAKLDGFLDPPTGVLRTYQATDPSAPARYARAVAEHRTGHSGKAIVILDGLISEQPRNPFLYELKGQVLFEAGQVRAAIAPYQEAVRLAPDQPLLRQSLGHVMIETGDRSLLAQAVAQLKLAQRHEPDDEETWHQLGIAFGRLGNLGEANLALAEEAMLGNDIPMARRFARQAAETLPPGPSRLRALDISNAAKKENRS